MHERTRRQITFLLFLVLCVVPTATVAAWGAWWRSAGHVRLEAERLSWLLGMNVSLSAIGHPKPGEVLYEGLELASPETGRVVLRCRTLRTGWETAKDQQGRERTVLAISAVEPEIEADQTHGLWQLVDRVLSRRPESSGVFARLAAERITVKTAQGAGALTDVKGSMESEVRGTWAGMSFHGADVEMPRAASLRLTRNCQLASPALFLDLDTGGAALPCSFPAPGLEWLAALGPRAKFCGTVSTDLTSEGTSGVVKAQLTDLDLATIVSRQFPQHTLTGAATLSRAYAEFRRGRLEKVEGMLEVVGGGTISRSLFDAAAEHLRLSGRWPADVAGTLPYERLGLAFAIDGGVLHLAGTCPLAEGRAILADHDRPLLAESEQTLGTVNIVQMLVPPTGVQVAASPQTEWLLRRLVIPASGSDAASLGPPNQ